LSSSPTETRAAVLRSARITRPLKSKLSGTRKRLPQPQRWVFRHPTCAPCPAIPLRNCCSLSHSRTLQVHLLGYEDGGLSAADYNSVAPPLIRSFLSHLFHFALAGAARCRAAAAAGQSRCRCLIFPVGPRPKALYMPLRTLSRRFFHSFTPPISLRYAQTQLLPSEGYKPAPTLPRPLPCRLTALQLGRFGLPS